MNRILITVVLTIATHSLTGAAGYDDCDVSACMTQINWPAGGEGPDGAHGIYDQIETCVNIANNGFFSQIAWLIVRFTGPDGKVYKPSEDEYFTLPDVGTSRSTCSIWSAISMGPNGTSVAPDGWYNETVQLELPSGDILDQENKTRAILIRR